MWRSWRDGTSGATTVRWRLLPRCSRPHRSARCRSLPYRHGYSAAYCRHRQPTSSRAPAIPIRACVYVGVVLMALISAISGCRKRPARGPRIFAQRQVLGLRGFAFAALSPRSDRHALSRRRDHGHALPPVPRRSRRILAPRNRCRRPLLTSLRAGAPSMAEVRDREWT